MNRKQFIVSTLFASILLTLVIIPITHQQIGGTYDPWLDYNEDGKIDVNDLHPLGQAYGTLGDPTKNVTTAGHVSKLIRAAVSVSVDPGPWGSWDSDLIWIDGYAKITILMTLNPSSLNCTSTVWAYDSSGITLWLVDTCKFERHWVKTYDVMNQQIRVLFYNINAFSITLNVDIYLVA